MGTAGSLRHGSVGHDDHAIGGARVLVAHGHDETRDSIVRSLEQGGYVVCAQVADTRSALEAVRDTHPDLNLLDAQLPPLGIDAVRLVLGAAPGVPVVMTSSASDDAQLFAALDAGVKGFLPDDVASDRLPRAIGAVLAGEAALPRVLVARVLREFSVRAQHLEQQEATSDSTLSRRQRQVLQLLMEQRSTAEIADALYIAKVTVRTHVSAILKKLDLPDRAALLNVMARVEGIQRVNI